MCGVCDLLVVFRWLDILSFTGLFLHICRVFTDLLSVATATHVVEQGAQGLGETAIVRITEFFATVIGRTTKHGAKAAHFKTLEAERWRFLRIISTAPTHCYVEF